MLLIKRLTPTSTVPTCSNPGEDLGFDLYADATYLIPAKCRVRVTTGIAARFINRYKKTDLILRQPKNILERFFGVDTIIENCMQSDNMIESAAKYGLLFRDRSSMANKGITVSGGVIDAGYTGELQVILTNNNDYDYLIGAGDKIVQMIPVEVNTWDTIKEVDKLPESNRADNGFGSTGK